MTFRLARTWAMSQPSLTKTSQPSAKPNNPSSSPPPPWAQSLSSACPPCPHVSNASSQSNTWTMKKKTHRSASVAHATQSNKIAYLWPMTRCISRAIVLLKSWIGCSMRIIIGRKLRVKEGRWFIRCLMNMVAREV